MWVKTPTAEASPSSLQAPPLGPQKPFMFVFDLKASVQDLIYKTLISKTGECSPCSIIYSQEHITTEHVFAFLNVPRPSLICEQEPDTQLHHKAKCHTFRFGGVLLIYGYQDAVWVLY
ncbi:hypothetical protein ILYODFUR_023509 [Ilyodon furcidens]|uniref:Uncharacterized protein n=1 Tax=Ilyodon furcidens TaxID=33524 RepID=A0ABV0SR66_9TELE